MSNLSISFHGGSEATSINNVLAFTPTDDLTPILSPNSGGAMPALSELRGLFSDPTTGKLYVVNAFKDFSQILTFSAPLNSGSSYTFDGVFAGGKDSQLAHPFCAVYGADGNVYVSNQDPLSNQKTSAITCYEGPDSANPGKFKSVFGPGFFTLRGIATDGCNWYVAGAVDSKQPAAVWIYDSKGTPQPDPLPVNEPVHLLYDGSRYLYIGSEKDNAVYQYDTHEGGTSLDTFICTSTAVPIDHTAGLAIFNGYFYVASRKGMAINQYELASPSTGSVYVSKLADSPEFILFL
jgi:hypothetical protein